MAEKICGIILAAGKGTRMKSNRPKVLHEVLGKPMINWVFDTLNQCGIEQICTVLSEDLHGFEDFLEKHKNINVAIQTNRMGTGDAVASAAYGFAGVKIPPYAQGRLLQGQKFDCDGVLICAGDVPAITANAISEFIEASLAKKAKISVLGMEVPHPTGYGRLVLKDQNTLDQIVEEKDATDEIRRVTLCNSGVIYVETLTLFELLSQLTNKNNSNEYYLTDCFKLARDNNIPAYVHTVNEYRNFAGVNTQDQLKELEEWMSSRKPGGY